LKAMPTITRAIEAKGEFLWVGEGDSRENFLHAIGLLEARSPRQIFPRSLPS
jgi:hypothetical protein